MNWGRFAWDAIQAVGCCTVAAVVCFVGCYFVLAVFGPGGKHEAP